MAIQIVSGNLNTIGNNGNFESDRSSWGFANTVPFTYTRSSAYSTYGLYSCKAFANTITSSNRGLALGSFIAQTGKKYVIYAKVRADDVNRIGVDTDKFAIVPGSQGVAFNAIAHDRVEGLFLDARAGFVEIETRFTSAINGVRDFKVILLNAASALADILVGGITYVDELSVYEYIDVPDVCTLEIDSPGTVVMNETTPGANDGSITVAITGGTGPFEYSKDGGTIWQAGNYFAGLGSGIYSIVVREIATITCNDAQSFAVNASAYAFSFTPHITNETISGANDGAVEVTVTGTVAPFTFSLDAGVTYQAGNIFTGLAPGVYTLVVKDAGDIIQSVNITIEMGLVVYEKIWHSNNPITLSKQAQAAWEVLVNYRLYDEVKYDSGGGVFESCMKVALVPIGQSSTFDVREAFTDLLKATINLSDDFVRLTDRLKAFRHHTGQVVELEDEPVSTIASNTHLVVMGGVSKERLPGLDFFGSLSTTKQFLTWAPLEKDVDRGQMDFLTYFVFDVLVSSLKLKVTAYYDDDTSENDITKTKEGVMYGELYQLPAGAVSCGATLINPAKNLIRYDIVLLDQDDVEISETRTYKIMAISHPRKKFFLFLNSLGGFEVLNFTGVGVDSMGIEKESLIKHIGLDYSLEDGELENVRAVGQLSHAYGSGYLSQEWLSYMPDFLMSKKVFVLDGNTAKPVHVKGANFPIFEDQNYERFIRFEALGSFQNENFTP